MNDTYEINTLKDLADHLKDIPDEAFEDATLIEMIIDAEVMGVMNPELAAMLMGNRL